MDLQVPSWLKYRQGELEPAGERCYKVSAPVSDPAYIRVRQRDGQWQAAVADAADGPDLRATEPVFPRESDAWSAAFELYRSARIY